MSQTESIEQVIEPSGDGDSTNHINPTSEPKNEPAGDSQQPADGCEIKSEPAGEPAGADSEQNQSEEPEKGDKVQHETCAIKNGHTENDQHQTCEPASEGESQTSEPKGESEPHLTSEPKSKPFGQQTSEFTSEPTTTIESSGGEPVVAETQEVSSTRNEDNHEENQQSKQTKQQDSKQQHNQEQHQKGHMHPKQHSMRSSSRRPSYNNTGRVYASGYQNYGLAYLPYKSNFEPSEDAKRRADEFLQTLKL